MSLDFRLSLEPFSGQLPPSVSVYHMARLMAIAVNTEKEEPGIGWP